MAIRRKGKMIKCPKCKSENIIVIKVRTHDNLTECQFCGELFSTKLPVKA